MEQIPTINGTKVMLDNSREATQRGQLENYRARQLYLMLKVQQPSRFMAMEREGKLIAFLNQTSGPYYQLAKELLLQGMTVSQAEETAWKDLIERAGL